VTYKGVVMKKILTGVAGLIIAGAVAAPIASASTSAGTQARLGGPAAAASVSASNPPSCGITWGSLAKRGGSMTTAPITDVRAGRHDCYDRLVVDISGEAGYRVGYVTSVVQDGSGRAVPLRGGAKLQIIVLAPTYKSSAANTFPATRSELVDVSGFSTFRQVAGAGSFEGQTTIGLGVRARLPFRVFTLAGPGSHSRLVVDVAHHW
jgi:hypothetical protein